MRGSYDKGWGRPNSIEATEDERVEVSEEVAPQLEPPYDIEVTVRDDTDAAAISIANDY